jgi:hypothetical protein
MAVLVLDDCSDLLPAARRCAGTVGNASDPDE